MDKTDETAALWRRWRLSAARGETAAPDPVMLAAYAEDRLPPDAAAAIEDWLVDNPEAIQDIHAARRGESGEVPPAPEAMIARASALIAAGDARIYGFHGRARPGGLRYAAAWGGVAASILVTSFVGFALGNDAYVNVANVSATSLIQEILDPPGGIFNSLDEDLTI